MVSTIVTLYNNENYIRDCLNSILSNLDTYKDIEIIIVNDKSTDNSLNIVNEYKENIQIIYIFIIMKQILVLVHQGKKDYNMQQVNILIFQTQMI